MGRTTRPRTRNPFPEYLPDLGVHREGCPGPESLPGYVHFAGRSRLPDPAETAEGLVLVGGRPDLGKSVFTHRCLHLYQNAGRLAVDLSAEPGHEIPDPQACLDRILYRLRQADVLSADDLEAVKSCDGVGPLEEHRALGQVLGDRRLVVRLPSPEPWLVPEAVARLAIDYARAASNANSSVYLFEFPYWQEEYWTRLHQEIGRTRYAALVHVQEITAFSSEELAAFLTERLSGRNLDTVFEHGPDPLFRAIARQRASLSPNNLRWFNTLCRHAFEAAIGDRADRVGLSHFLAAALRSGTP